MRMMHSFTLIYVVNKQTISKFLGNLQTPIYQLLWCAKNWTMDRPICGSVLSCLGCGDWLGITMLFIAEFVFVHLHAFDFYNSHTKPNCREQCTNGPYPNFPISRVNGIKCKMQNDSFKRSEQPSNGNSLRWSSLISLTFEKFLFWMFFFVIFNFDHQF